MKYFVLVLLCVSPFLSADTQKTAYRFTHRVENAGFFSVFNAIVGALNFYDIHEEVNALLVDFEDNGYYYDKEKGLNWWSYYFDMNMPDLPENYHEKRFKAYQKIIFSLYAQFDMPRERAHTLINRYIRIKPHIFAKIDHFYNTHFSDSYVIGLHYRSTDKHSEAPKIPYESVRAVVATTAQLARVCQNKSIKLFVATDDAHFLSYITAQFDDGLVCAIDAVRSHTSKSVHVGETEKNYQKGEDALIDCVLLSKCNELIKMDSNLSDTSLMFNPSLPFLTLNQGYGA